MSRLLAGRTGFRDWYFPHSGDGARPRFSKDEPLRPHGSRRRQAPPHHEGQSGLEFSDMPVPQHVFDPPFNIVRSSHVVLDVTDLDASRRFYENAVGLHLEDKDDDAIYL